MAQDQKVEIKTGKIELPKLDVQQYVGKQVKVTAVETRHGANGFYVRFETEPVTTITNSKGETIPIRASKLVGLQDDGKGNVGWGENTKMSAFLTAHKVDHFEKLMGKTVVLQTQLSKDGVHYLTFN